ncbi:hypothetical protein AQPW35_01040 [Rubrivivax pictus]|uniref:Uncharacterized protein n=1 Tax=Pseudaquabacterium pictum TaxID=2315236 RepID=A0A480AHY0_9BURK|nr:hypothetical protein AQPW35_01040 [Rubrivivax pictus]
MAKQSSRSARDGGQFLALPHVVLQSPGWAQAGHTARSLLIDIACQYTGRNNGRLVATLDHLSRQGWKSPAVIGQARQELIACGLLAEVRKGGFPNRAAWHALTWLALDQSDGLDFSPRSYETLHRRAYMRPVPYVRPSRVKSAQPATRHVAEALATATRQVAEPSIPDMRCVAVGG